MKNILFTFCLFALTLFLFSACEKSLLGDEPNNDPITNFELYWNDINEHYGIFLARNFNWDSIYTAYKPLVNDNTTDDELWNTMTEMLDYLDDSHAFISNRETGDLFISGYTLNQASHNVFRANPYKENYLENVAHPDTTRDPNKLVLSGKVKDKDIGYIWLGAFDDYDEYLIDDFIEEQQNYKAILLDIRSNGGGDANIAQFIASRFGDASHLTHTSQDKIGPGPNDFAEKVEWYSLVDGPQQFIKPVIVLTNRATISAAEDFLLYMKSYTHTAQIGDITAGDFSNTSMHRFLPNGWEYRYSTQMYLLPDGTSLDGVGHHPDILVKNEMENVDAGQDLVIEAALQYLFDVYGIE